MAFYSYIFSANYKRFLNRLKEVAKQENKSYIGMIFDTVYCVFRYGLGLTDYLSFQIYNKTAKERKEYVGTRMENKFYEKAIEVATNKTERVNAIRILLVTKVQDSILQCKQ